MWVNPRVQEREQIKKFLLWRIITYAFIIFPLYNGGHIYFFSGPTTKKRGSKKSVEKKDNH